MTTSIIVEENVTQVSVINPTTQVTVQENLTTVNLAASSAATLNAATLAFDSEGTLNASNVQDAIEELRDQFYRSDTAPTGNNLDEGDLWYDTDDDQLKVYRETSTNTFEFVPLAAATGTMDNLDGGLF